MKKNRILFIVLAVAGVFAFRGNRPAELVTTTYGTCSCAERPGDPVFRLTVKEDHTFRYVSTMDPKKPIDVTGKWEADGRKILLKDVPAGLSIHDQWKLEHQFPCITSRKGLEFSRLCAEQCDR